jgi:4-hydroxy-2-oxovalerate aldolase
MDCTIRDGSYAIDFKFTAADTALVVGLLDDAGLPYVEIGHGLGLGASRVGKQAAPCSDLEVIQRSRERTRQARLGAFFIPSIGNQRDLREAAAAGLDFVRVGNNADEMEAAWPSLQTARSAGLESFVNLMKTYGIPPRRFAEIAVEAERRGAAGVYVVDSAGGMLPGEVAEYVRAARECTTIPIGFHGHSNLHLAVANALAAIEAGASFIDTSVYGIGRSSGNVPTEVMAVVLERLGVESGLDPQKIMGLAESYLRPLAENLHPHDMIAVALGYGRFHSSYLPRALQAAEEAQIDPLRLIVALGQRDTMRLPERLLHETVEQLRGTPRPSHRDDLAIFRDDRFGPRRIGNRPGAVVELLDDLDVVAAKRHLKVVLDLTLSSALDEQSVTAEFLLEDNFAALGRIRAGSVGALATELEPQESRAELLLLDAEGIGADQVPEVVRALERVSRANVVVYRSGDLITRLLGDVALALIGRLAPTRMTLVDPGWLAIEDMDALAERLAQIVPLRRTQDTLEEEPSALCVVAGPVISARPEAQTTIWPVVLGMGPGPAPGWAPNAILLTAADAYRNRAPEWLAAARTSAVARQTTGAST